MAYVDDEDDDDSLWDLFTRNWEQEFERASAAEDAFLARRVVQATSLATKQGVVYEAAVEAAVRESDAAARRIAAQAGAVLEAERAQAFVGVRDAAEEARRRIANDAYESSDDMLRQIRERRERLDRDKEAQRKEEKRRWEAECEAKRAARAARAGEEPVGGASKPKAEPRRPSADAGKNGRRLPSGTAVDKPPPRINRSEGFASFGEYEAAWSRFEAPLLRDSAAVALRCDDIPWPTSLPTISGVEAEDSARVKKQKLRAAVLRWHPDKWGNILARVCDEERAQVVERVKEVTRRILEERKRFVK